MTSPGWSAAVDLTSLRVVLDGSEIRGLDKMRVTSTFNDLTMPADNVGAATGAPWPGGVHGAAYQTGFWCMLRPLSPGPHTLRIAGTARAPFAFTVDVTYELEVIDNQWPEGPSLR